MSILHYSLLGLLSCDAPVRQCLARHVYLTNETVLPCSLPTSNRAEGISSLGNSF